MRLPPLPANVSQNVQGYLRALARYAEMGMRERTPDNTGRHSVILLSPDGAAWEVTVANDGTLTSTKVQG